MWRRLARLSAWQWSVLLSAPILLLTTWVKLKSGGYGKTLAWVTADNVKPGEPGVRPALARDTAYALAVAVKYGPWRPRCLVRSMTLAWYLGRKGIPFELKIGVPVGLAVKGQRIEPDFTAHAWVESGGVVLNDRENIAEEYSAFGRDDRR